METEEKENSNPSNKDSKLTLTEMDSQQQHELPNTEPQCDPVSASELHHSQLGSVNSESHHQQKQSPQSPQKPSQTESAVVDKSEASQDFIVQESQSDFPSPSLQPPVAETVDGNAMEVKEESLDIERPSQEPLQQEAVEKEVEAGKLVAGAESHRINEDSNLDKDEDVNVNEHAHEHAHAHAGNNEIEHETVGVAGVPVELETETISEEVDIVEKAEVSDARAESVMADIVEKTEVVAVEEGKEKDVADVEEKVETDDAVEGDETVGNVEKEKVVDTDDVVEGYETVGNVREEQMAKTEVDAVEGEQTEVTGTEEDEKVERKDVADISEEMKSAGQTGITDIVDETKAEEDVTDMAEEKEAMEHIEMTSVAEEKKALDDIEEMEAAGETEEAVNVGGEKEETEMVDVAEERDTEEDMDLADGTEAMETAEEEEKVNEEEEAEMADETEEADEEVGISVGGKRKRGKATKTPRPPSKKKMEEDVCFICFDGGELVLCDRRGCPKAYHPSCVNRDEAFFRAKGRWNCGWHLCSNCEKNAHYMCYTCTFSLCKGCTKDAVILCVRGNKGFCETCMKTVMLIERNEQGNRDTGQVDFDDKSSWEYLFKDYWTDLKQRLSLTLEELVQAKNPRKGSDLHSGKQESPDELYDVHNDGRSDSDSSETAEATTSKRKKPKKRLKSRAKRRGSPGTASASRAGGESADESEWASKELLEFVMHMKNGNKSVCSQFDVQALLLEYIKRNKLRDPRRKSQIICDSRLENLFGKPRVGHFEMLKLLESHFILKDESQVEDLQGSVVDTESNQLEADENSDALMSASRDKRRKSRKKGDRRGLQSNVDDYAAIDMHNINLIFLRRSLLEDLIENTETFHDKVVGSFVRIRISGSAQKQDLYRLVQVVGTSKAAELYRVGKKMTSFMLEILNLNKTEVVSIDIISNQEFTEDECKRLRQSIKCGLINRLTVGDIQEKAMALQAARVQDSLETEITRLSHLRDRASDMGRRKELRECVEKLQLLKSPEERQRRLEEIPEIHADPNMDPSHESDEDEGETEDKRQESSLRPRGSSFSRRGREPISPRSGGFTSNDTWSGSRNYSSMNRELSRNMSDKGFSSKGDDVIGAGEMVNQNLLGQGRDKQTQQSQSWEKPKTTSSASQSISSMVTSESVARGAPEISSASLSTRIAQPSAKVNETEKIWHYQDPSGKIQGPFSMVQLRKWSNTGYFPGNLMIWRTTETKGDSILLTNALAGNFQIDPPAVDNSFMRTQSVQSPHLSSSSSGNAGTATPAPVEVPKYSTDTWGSETNLPSPTPGQSSTSGTKGHVLETQWSPTPAQPVGSVLGANLPSGSNIELQHPTVVVSGSGQVPHTLTPSSLSTKPSGQLDGSNMSHGVSPVPQIHSQSIVLAESPRVPVNSHMLPLPDSSAPSVNTAVDMRSLQNLVQPVTSSNSSIVGTHGWGAGSISRPEMNPSHAVHGTGSQAWGSTPSQKLETNNLVSLSSQPNSGYGKWGNAPTSVKHSTLSLTTGTSSGVSPVPGAGTNPWRALVPAQPVIQPSAPSSGPWGMGMADNQNAIPRQGPENQNTTWGPTAGNQNMGWGSLSTNSNQGWVVAGQVPAPVNANLGWAPAVQGQAPGNANPGWGPPQAPGNAFSGFGPSGQGSAPANANNWVPPGNANTNRATASGNTGTWGSDMNQNGDRFSSHKDRGSHGGDSGFSGGKPWNRQSSFNRSGDSSRLPFKGQRVCKFHENGHCKKGASCDYMHS